MNLLANARKTGVIDGDQEETLLHELWVVVAIALPTVGRYWPQKKRKKGP